MLQPESGCPFHVKQKESDMNRYSGDEIGIRRGINGHIDTERVV